MSLSRLLRVRLSAIRNRGVYHGIRPGRDRHHYRGRLVRCRGNCQPHMDANTAGRWSRDEFYCLCQQEGYI